MLAHLTTTDVMQWMSITFIGVAIILHLLIGHDQ